MRKLSVGIILLNLIFANHVSANILANSPQEKITGNVERVLFFGNSFSYYNNNVSTHVRELARSLLKEKAENYAFRSLSISSGRLGWHKENLKLQNSLAKWDTVIFQAQSNEAISSKTEERAFFEKSAQEMSDIAHKAGERVIYFVPWSYPNKNNDLSETTKKLMNAYQDIAKQTHSYVAPVGLAFRNLQLRYPEINLYAKDNKHPSAEGTYLAACVLFAVLYNQSPIGGKVPADFDMSSEVIYKIQSIAWESVQQYQN